MTVSISKSYHSGFASETNDTKHYERSKLINGDPYVDLSAGIELDAFIPDTKIALEKLLSGKRKLQAELNPIHDCVTHRLPPELSAHIFLFSLSGEKPHSFYEDDLDNFSESHLITTPLTLGAVCRAWRSIAWAWPNLWTDISVPVKSGRSTEYLSIVDDWIGRSGQLPLSLYFYIPRRSHRIVRKSIQLFDRVSGIILLHISRCRRLEVSCSTRVLPSVALHAPMLEEIKITSNAHNRKLKPIELYSTNPEGVHVSLTGYDPKLLVLPAENVKECEGYFTWEECISILEKYSNLREFRTWELGGSPPSDPAPHILHECLEKLTLHSWHRSSSCPVLDAVTLPYLTHLSVSNLDVESSHSIRDFVCRSACSLEYLRLENLWCGGEELLDMLRPIKSLKELHLIQVEDGNLNLHVDVLFEELAQNPVSSAPANLNDDPNHLLPNLSILTIRFSKEVDFPWDLAAGIFGSLDNVRDPLRRPINDMQMIHDWRIGNPRHNLEEPILSGAPLPRLPALFIDKEVTQQFLDIAREGIKINLYDMYANNDILQLSLLHHDIAVPEWYEIINQSVCLTALSAVELPSDWLDLDDEISVDLNDSQDDSDSEESDSASEYESVHETDSDSDRSSISDQSDTPYVQSIGLQVPSGFIGTTMDMLAESESDSEYDSDQEADSDSDGSDHEADADSDESDHEADSDSDPSSIAE